MSPVAGVWPLDGTPPDSTLIDGMVTRLPPPGLNGARTLPAGLAALAHRGPHAEWRDGGQPLEAPRAGPCVTADARLDNRRDLLRTLGLEHRAGAIGDAELILRAYETWGEHCPDRLIGDFAFVIWDRHAHKMLCARDPFGVRPLYYHYQPFRLFAFASEISSILALPAVRERDIFPIPPGHVLAVGPGWARRRQFAEIDQLEGVLSEARESRPTIVLNFHL